MNILNYLFPTINNRQKGILGQRKAGPLKLCKEALTWNGKEQDNWRSGTKRKGDIASTHIFLREERVKEPNAC